MTKIDIYQDVSVIEIAAGGIQGPKGDKGDGAATVTVGTTTTGAAGANASVTNSGTVNDVVLNFTVPQGLKGDTGNPGTNGTNGADGADGDSAYQVAVNNGFLGTEQQWLESLVGETGAQGTPGLPGADGADGLDGEPGAGIIAGGTAGQVLTKIDSTDYNTQWSTLDLSAKQDVVSGVSSTEIGYLDGVTSSIQTQLNTKAPITDPIFTGTATTNNLIVDGDFTVNGTNFAASATSITIEDNLIQIAHNNPANTVDLGIVVGYNDGTAKHAGLVKDTSDNYWKLFKDVTTEPTTTVDFTQGSLDNLAVAAFAASSISVGSVSNTEFGYLNGVTSSIQTQLNEKAVYPTQSGNNGKYLTTDGSTTSWATISSVAAATPSVAGSVYGLTEETYDTTALGISAGLNLTTGANNTIIGHTAGNSLTTGSVNVLVGNGAGANSGISTEGMTSIGYGSGTETSGSFNTFLGNSAGKFIVGQSNIGIGVNALDLDGVDVTSINYNTVLGGSSLYSIEAGDSNIAIGYSTAQALVSGSNNIIIGSSAEASSTTVSNEITLGNSSINKLRVPGIGLVASTTSTLFGAPIKEKINSLGTVSSGPIAFNILTASVINMVVGTGANFTINFRGSSTVTLNSMLDINESITVVFIANSAGSYYPNTLQIDGGAGTIVNNRWQGGTAPTAGTGGSADVYTFNIQKVANNLYQMFSSQTKFG